MAYLQPVTHAYFIMLLRKTIEDLDHYNSGRYVESVGVRTRAFLWDSNGGGHRLFWHSMADIKILGAYSRELAVM